MTDSLSNINQANVIIVNMESQRQNNLGNITKVNDLGILTSFISNKGPNL